MLTSNKFDREEMGGGATFCLLSYSKILHIHFIKYYAILYFDMTKKRRKKKIMKQHEMIRTHEYFQTVFSFICIPQK